MSELGESAGIIPIPDDNETPPEEQERKPISIRFSIFFDGTLNNRKNIEARELASSGQPIPEGDEEKKAMVKAYHKHKEEGSSFENGLTNIAKMELFVGESEGYDHSFFTYIEGIGTKNLGGDETRGYAFGTGDTGVPMKVLKGMLEVVNAVGEKLDEDSEKIYIKKFTLDVFGFSRGAAAARNFIYSALNARPRGRVPARPLRKRLTAMGFAVDENAVEIHFAGLYDTVASFGLSHTNDTRQLHLDSIGTFKAKKVTHLVAADEHRANFSMTNIDSATNGDEIFLPGVHSDVGGSYYNPHPGQDNPEYLTLNESRVERLIQQDREYLIDMGWYKEHEIWIEEQVDPAAMALGGGYGGYYSAQAMPMIYTLKVARRHVESEYSNIPLHIMAVFAREEKINLKSRLEKKNKIYKLNSEKSKLMSYAKKGGSKVSDWSENKEPWVKALRNGHLHFSAHLKTAAAGLIKPNKPNVEDGRRERKVNKG